MQNTAWDLSCRSGTKQCISKLANLFNETMKACNGTNGSDLPCNKIPLNLRNVAYCNAMMNTDDHAAANASYAFILNKYKYEVNNDERLALLYGLSCAKYDNNIVE